MDEANIITGADLEFILLSLESVITTELMVSNGKLHRLSDEGIDFAQGLFTKLDKVLADAQSVESDHSHDFHD